MGPLGRIKCRNKRAAKLGFHAVELFTDGPNAGKDSELKNLLEETGLALGAYRCRESFTWAHSY